MRIMSNVLFVLAVLAVLQHSTNAAACPAAIAMPSFRAWLEAATPGIIISAADPETTISAVEATFCQSLWGHTNGGCCKTSLLQSTFEKKMAVHQTAWTDFIVALSTISQSINKISKLTADSYWNTAELLSIRAEITDTGLLKYLEDLSNSNVLGGINFHTSYNASLKNFQSDAKACFEKTMSYYGKAFCYGCYNAAFGSTFTADADGTITMRKFSCQALYASCYRVWSFIDKVGSMVQLAAAINKRRKNTGVVTRPTDGQYFNSRTEDAIRGIWQSCTTSSAVGACSDDFVRTSCQAHVNIKLPIIRLSTDNMKPESLNFDARRQLATAESYLGIVLVDTDNSKADLIDVSLAAPTLAATFPVNAIKFVPDADVDVEASTISTGEISNLTFIRTLNLIAIAAIGILAFN